MAVIRVHVFFCGPSKITVVKDIVLAVFRSYCIRFKQVTFNIGMPYSETKITDNKILRSAELRFMMGNDYSYTGCSLTGKGKVLPTVKIESIYQPDLSGNCKTNGQWLSRVLLDSPTKRTLRFSVGIIRQGRYIHHLAATSAGGIFAKTLCAGKSYKGIR